MRRKTIIIQPYDKTLVVFACKDQAELQAELSKIDSEHKDDLLYDALTLTVSEAGIWKQFLFIDMSENPTPGLIAHECLHVVDRIFQRIGHQHHPEYAEPTAYLLGWLTDQIWNHITK